MTSIGRHKARSRRWVLGIITLSIAGMLAAVTTAATLLANDDAAPISQASAQASPSSSAPSPSPRATVRPTAIATLATPSPEPTSVPQVGSGMFELARGSSEQAGTAGSLITYRVEVEKGLGLSVGRFSQAVEDTLGDGRGWTSGAQYSFRRTKTAPLRVVLASPATTDRLCAPLQTRGEVSCRNGNNVVINAKRWVKGVRYYDDLKQYRHYVINHEVGHALGFGHVTCPAPGQPAPVMLQQTLGLGGCAANPWP